MSHDAADSALADAIWWFKGYVAGSSTDVTDGVIDRLRRARQWIDKLASGDARLIGTDEREQAFAITEREFEQIMDALHPRSTKADREIAESMLRRVHSKVTSERAPQDLDIPF